MEIDRAIEILENNKKGFYELVKVSGNEETKEHFNESVQAFELAINKLKEEKKIRDLKLKRGMDMCNRITEEINKLKE